MFTARNGIRYLQSIKEQAVAMRRAGKTHREIAGELRISLSTAFLWVKNIQITADQKQVIEARRPRHKFNHKEIARIKNRLRPFQYKRRYSTDDLLNKIREFHRIHNRIPLKKEFNALRTYRLRFGS